jgi:undecaprenyl-diphosphatase
LAWWAAFIAAHGAWGIFLLAFAESLFLPVPPDVLLVPLVLADPGGAVRYTLLATLGSVLGGATGWGAGRWGGRRFLAAVFPGRWVREADVFFARWGVWAVAIAAVTPVPYKVCTVVAGACRMGFGPFAATSLVSRGARFAVVALLVRLLGPVVLNLLTGPLAWASLGLALAAGLVWVLARRR